MIVDRMAELGAFICCSTTQFDEWKVWKGKRVVESA